MTEKVMRLRDGEKWVRYSDYEAETKRLKERINHLESMWPDQATLTARVEELEESLRSMNKVLDDEHSARLERVSALEGQNTRLREAIRWALGYTDFRERREGEGPYWWRTELRKRSGYKEPTDD